MPYRRCGRSGLKTAGHITRPVANFGGADVFETGAPSCTTPSITGVNPFRSRQQLRAPYRLGGREFWAGHGDRLQGSPGRTGHLD